MSYRRDPWTIAAGTGMAAIFGFSFLFTKTALARLSPVDLLGLRFTLAALGLGASIAAGAVRVNLGRGRWRRLLPLAFFQP
ncbi:MAG: EamA family transporter, partial [Bacteroidota bacterium]